MPELLADRRIASVTGTNGKTTTTHFLTAAVRAGTPDGQRSVVTNADGANLHHGIVSALGEAPDATIAVLETDERVVADVVAMGNPEVLVLLNFSRDQLDRNHELTFLGRDWRDALEKAAEHGPTVVANACDPLIVWVCQKARHVIWVDTKPRWTADSTLCPNCGTVLTHGEGGWDCPGCELSQPAADWWVEGDEAVEASGRRFHLDVQVAGSFNLTNAICALAAAIHMGIQPEDALRGIATVESPAGRYATCTIGGTHCRLLLSKNPAGWTESLPLTTSDPLVLAIDAVAADGKDVSWLWDVDYEQLAIYLLGGGEDTAQITAVRELKADGGLFTALDDGAMLFAVCAGYQICGRSFTIGARDEVIAGLGLLDAETRRGPERAVGEVLHIWTQPDGNTCPITGFENHGGWTELGSDAKPLAAVEVGWGNGNRRDEGAVQDRVIGTYPHGPVLARNPQLADHVLEIALGHHLEPLDLPEITALRQRRIDAVRTGRP